MNITKMLNRIRLLSFSKFVFTSFLIILAFSIPANAQSNSVDKRDGEIVRIEPNSDSHVYAYSYRNWNLANWGKYENIGAGWNPTGGEKRTFLKFDLAGIDPNSVNKATLKLYHIHTGGGNAVDLGVYRVMSPWQEGSGTYHSGQTEKPASSGEISWVNQPEIDRYAVVYFNPGQEINKWIEVDVTSLVKAWLTGIPNHGMAIKGRDNLSGKPESQYGFRSREFEDSSKRPHLVLNGSGNINGGKVNSSAIVGKWKWFTDVIVTIYSNGKVSWSKGTGMWKKNINGSAYEYVINWDNGYVDRLNLTGQTLKGVNQNGTPVWGERIK